MSFVFEFVRTRLTVKCVYTERTHFTVFLLLFLFEKEN